MVERIEPLDLGHLLVNGLAGSAEVFTALVFIAVVILCGFFRVPDLVMGVFIFLAAGFMFQFMPVLLLIIISIGGMLIFWVISRLVKR